MSLLQEIKNSYKKLVSRAQQDQTIISTISFSPKSYKCDQKFILNSSARAIPSLSNFLSQPFDSFPSRIHIRKLELFEDKIS